MHDEQHAAHRREGDKAGPGSPLAPANPRGEGEQRQCHGHNEIDETETEGAIVEEPLLRSMPANSDRPQPRPLSCRSSTIVPTHIRPSASTVTRLAASSTGRIQ